MAKITNIPVVETTKDSSLTAEEWKIILRMMERVFGGREIKILDKTTKMPKEAQL